jgi:uncharacterized protein YkwD
MEMDRRIFVSLLCLGASTAGARTSGAREVEEQILSRVNRERRSRRLPVLTWNDDLAALARRHSERMDARGFFGHRDPERGSLGDRLRSAGIRYRACAENLYQQSGLPDPAAEAVKAWLRSRGHRSNLLSRQYALTGIGVSLTPENQYTVTQIFLT